jgi:transcriptional regulator with XRE-family HTH domain
MTFGKRLRQVRENAKMTRRQLADALGHVHQNYVGNWEEDKSIPRLSTLFLIAKALNVTAMELLRDVEG